MPFDPSRRRGPAPGALERVPGVLHLFHRPLFGSDALTVREHIECFSRLSAFPVWTVNTALGVPPQLGRLRFDAVMLHYSIFSAAGYHLDDAFRAYLAECCHDSYKIAIFQDEYQYCSRRFAFLDDFSINCIFSCVDEALAPDVYGARRSVERVVSCLPGYVSEDLRALADRFALPDADRSIDVGYRGRPLPAYAGTGGQEKYLIGVEFERLAKGSSLTLDIDCREEGRIYGDAWPRFVGSCKSMLGTESGVSCMDIEDEVREDYERIRDSLGGREPTIDEMLSHGNALGKWDNRFPYRTLAPRHFDAAAFRTCQVMFEGAYSGAMESMVHYIPLRKDFANIQEVIDQLSNKDLRTDLTRNARRDLIDSGDYDYRAFVKSFDEVLRDAGLEAPSNYPYSPIAARLRQSRLARAGAYARFAVYDFDFRGRRSLEAAGRPLVRKVRRLKSRANTVDGRKDEQPRGPA